MLNLLLSLSALAAEPPVTPEVMLGAGLGGGMGFDDTSGGSSGGVSAVWFPVGRLGIDLGVREGLWVSPMRTVGEIDAGVRYRVADRVDVMGGFAHHHETPWADFKHDPVGAAAGIDEHIDHRSGARLGASVGFPLVDGEKVDWTFRLEPAVSVLAGVGPLVYGQVNAGIWVEIPELRHRD